MILFSAEQYISLINGRRWALCVFFQLCLGLNVSVLFVLQPTFTPSSNQRGAVKLTPHHCPVYVITTACSLLPRQRSEECPRLIKTKDLIKTHLPHRGSQ